MLARVLAVIMCSFVCLSYAGIVSARLNVKSHKQRHVIAQRLQFSDANSRWCMGDASFPLKFALKVTHPFRTQRF